VNLPSSVSYVRIYAGPDGASHFADDAFELETTASGVGVGPSTAAAAWEVRVVPVGWSRDWAPASEVRMAIYLAGEAEIEASDGEARQLVPGTVLLAEDTTGVGHRVRVTGPGPVIVVHIIPA
jgi:hypothetical protein